MSSSVHIDNINKAVSILGKGPTQWLDDTKLSAELELSQRKVFIIMELIAFYLSKPQNYINLR